MSSADKTKLDNASNTISDMLTLKTYENKITSAYHIQSQRITVYGKLVILNVSLDNGAGGFPMQRISPLFTINDPTLYPIDNTYVIYKTSSNDNWQNTSFTEALDAPGYYNRSGGFVFDLGFATVHHSGTTIPCVNVSVIYFIA